MFPWIWFMMGMPDCKRTPPAVLKKMMEDNADACLKKLIEGLKDCPMVRDLR